jgi:hypothetical protein
MLARTTLAGLLALFLFLPARAGDKKAEEGVPARADAAAFEAYLRDNKLDGRWQGPPIRLDSAEMRKTYGPYRAYYTWAAPPTRRIGGAAPSQEELRRFAQALADYKKRSLRIAVLIHDGKVTPLTGPAAFNTGLMPVKTEADARVAAAAILSLQQGPDVCGPPAAVRPKDVQVRRTGSGWSCTLPLHFNAGFAGEWGGQGIVVFDDAGLVTEAAKQVRLIAPYRGPYPPSALPRGTLPPVKKG